MSKITAVFNQIILKLGEQFPTGLTEESYSRIPNPYDLSSNIDHFLRKGWGLKVGEASPEEHEFCNFMMGRSFTVVFSREAYHLSSENKETDEAVLALMEDVVSVQKLFYHYNELGIEAQIAKVDLGSSTEVTTTIGEKQAFLSMEVSFVFNIIEQI